MKKALSVMILSLMLFGSIININASTDLTEKEHNCCIISENTPILDTTVSITPRTANQLPSSVDLSKDDAFPCIRDQGNINSCVGWASTYYQFGYQVAAMNGWNAKNDATKQFSPKWTYNILSHGVNAGLDYDDVYRLLSTQGAVRYSEFVPLTHTDSLEYKEWYTETVGIREALRYRISDVQYLCFADSAVNTPITSPNSTALTSMKSYINSGHVLTCVTDTITWVVQNLSNQYNTTLNGQYVCTMLDESIHTGNNGHALSIVGYDDNIQCDIDGDGTIQEYEKGAFKIADSSGVNEWNQGYIWVMYDALNKESNADLGDSVRHGDIIINYSYYVIEVEEKPLDLTAEITMSCSVKSSINLQLGLSPITETIAQEYSSTMFNYNGAKLNFSGSGKTEEESTFVFDFGNLCSSPVGWKNYYLCIRNNNGSYSATIKNIKLIDKTGKTVLNDTEDKALLNSSGDYRYCIAMVGDIDNDGVVSTNDGTLIQHHLARYITLTDEQLTVADVDGDGIVNIFDKTDIERYLLGLSEEFSNGEYVYIE